MQLSLFVSGPFQQELERIRVLVDPVQSALIPAHVTLCREEEVELLSSAATPSKLEAESHLALRFGAPKRCGSHGIILPCIDGEERYSQLRQRLLGPYAKRSEPHITMAHPRNPRASGNKLEAVTLALPATVVFDRAVLIKQGAMNEAWQIIEEFRFSGRFHA